jgi:hypothetical protein
MSSTDEDAWSRQTVNGEASDGGREYWQLATVAPDWKIVHLLYSYNAVEVKPVPESFKELAGREAASPCDAAGRPAGIGRATRPSVELPRHSGPGHVVDVDAQTRQQSVAFLAIFSIEKRRRSHSGCRAVVVGGGAGVARARSAQKSFFVVRELSAAKAIPKSKK